MSEEIFIKGLTIAIGDKTIVLTLEEAKKLKIALDDIFKEKVTYVPTQFPAYPYPQDWITLPYYYSRPSEYFPGAPYKVTCESITSAHSTSTGNLYLEVKA